MFIYTLAFPLGKVRYVGKADNPTARLKKHLQEARRRMKNRRDKWLSSLNGDIPHLTVVEEVSLETWQDRERHWISKLKSEGHDLVNGTSGGEGGDGFRGKKHSEATKSKLRELSLGRKVSEETLIKLRNRRHSPETKEKLRLARLGKKVSVSTRRKLTESALYRPHTKLSNEDVLNILAAIASKEPQVSIAKRFGISRAYVLMLKKGKYRSSVSRLQTQALTPALWP